MTHTPRWRPKCGESTFKFKYVIKCKFWNSRWPCSTLTHIHTHSLPHIHKDDKANYKDQASAKFCHLIEIFAPRLKLAFCCHYNKYMCVCVCVGSCLSVCVCVLGCVAWTLPSSVVLLGTPMCRLFPARCLMQKLRHFERFKKWTK